MPPPEVHPAVAGWFSDRFGTAVAVAVLALAAPAALAVANRSFTVSEGTNFSIDAAPDGQRAVLDLQGRLWIPPLAGGDAVPITDGLGDDRLPRWSPDGRWITYQTFREGSWDIALIQPDGKGARRLTVAPGDEREPVWSTDGRAVIYAGDSGGGYHLHRLDIITGIAEQLTQGPHEDFAPGAAPDGAIAFISDRGGSTALWLRERDGVLREIWKSPARRLAAPRFSPDGARLALVVPVEELNFPAMVRWRLHIVARASGAVVAPETSDSDLFPFAPAWLDGERLLYTADGGVRLNDLAAGTVTTVPFSARFDFQPARRPRTPALESSGSMAALGIVEPTVAPDGRRIVFTALGDLWQRDQAGEVTRLTADVFVERDATFSPDGRQLLYISDRGGSMQVWSRDVASGAARALTSVTGGVRYPVMSPDGSKLVFQQPGPRGTQDFTVRLLDLASGAQRRLKTPPVWPGRMAFTGDGRHVAVLVMTSTSPRSREGVNRLGVAGLDDDSWRVASLPTNFMPEGGVVAAPDGSQLLLLHDGAPWLLPVTPSGEPAGVPWLLRDELADSPSFTADGRHVVYLGTGGLRRVEIYSGRARRLPLRLRWSAQRQEQPLLIRAGRLYDGRADRYRENVDVLVRDGRIVSVAPRTEAPAGVRVIDASAQTLLPGLIENHAHHQAHDGEWVGRAWLAFGVTTVIEPGGLPYESRELHEAWDSGARPGPRLLFAGPQLDGTRRYFPFASHISNARRLQRELERGRYLGYSLLKTYTRMPPVTQAKLIAGTRLTSSSHEIYPALALGGSRVEHLRGSSRAGYSTKQTDLLHSYADVTSIITAPRAVVSPTLVVSGGFFDYWLSHPELGRNRQFEALYPSAYRAGLQGFAQVVARRAPLLREGLVNARAATLALHRGGARIVAGTDAPIFPYGLSLVVELANYVAAGLTPAEALHTATGGAAAALGLDAEIGVAEPGRLADLLIVDGDPLRDVSELLKVSGVVRGGRYHDLEELLAPPVAQ